MDFSTWLYYYLFSIRTEKIFIRPFYSLVDMQTDFFNPVLSKLLIHKFFITIQKLTQT
jgi:hypothetical protein